MTLTLAIVVAFVPEQGVQVSGAVGARADVLTTHMGAFDQSLGSEPIVLVWV